MCVVTGDDVPSPKFQCVRTVGHGWALMTTVEVSVTVRRLPVQGPRPTAVVRTGQQSGAAGHGTVTVCSVPATSETIERS